MSHSTLPDPYFDEKWMNWQQQKQGQQTHDKVLHHRDPRYDLMKRRDIGRHEFSLQVDQEGMTREGIYAAFAQAQQEETRKATLGRRKSLKDSLDFRPDRKLRQESVDDFVPAAKDNEYYDNTFWKLEKQLTSEAYQSDVSKVSTYKPDLISTISAAQSWLDRQQDEQSGTDKGKQDKRRQSAIATVNNDINYDQLHYTNITSRLRPKAKSMRDRREHAKEIDKTPRTMSILPTSRRTKSPTPDERSSGTSHVKYTRSRSRVLRSPPPPPPADDDSTEPPSLPNVDVKQIKDEIDTSPSVLRPLRTSSRPSNDGKKARTDQNLTDNIINNVKRRLSLGKERKLRESDASEHTSLLASPASVRKRTLSTGSNFKPTESDRHRSVTGGHRIIPPRATSQRHRSGANTPPSGNRAMYGEDCTDEAAHISIAVDSVADIPPVPPMPSHHSLLTVDATAHKSHSKAEGSGRTSSANPVLGVSADDQTGIRKSLRRKLSRGSSCASIEDSVSSVKENESRITRTKKKSLTSAYGDLLSSETANCSSLSGSPSLNNVTYLWRKKSIGDRHEQASKHDQEIESRQRMEDNRAKTAKVATRKRGKVSKQSRASIKLSLMPFSYFQTLPGNLAAPPAVPSLPLPPMKVEPINLTIPEASTRKAPPKSPLSHTAITPTRIPMPKFKYSSSSAATTPVAPSGTSSEEEIIVEDGTTRRRKSASRTSLGRQASGTKSSTNITPPSSADVSPKVHAKKTTGTTTLENPLPARKQSLSASSRHMNELSPKMAAQATGTRSRKTSGATTGSFGLTTPFDALSRKSSIASAELEALEKEKGMTILGLVDIELFFFNLSVSR